jgi:small-conductance mechanosensitive channel
MTMLFPTTAPSPVQASPVQATVVEPSFTDALVASFHDAFSMILSAIPRILGFIIIVAIGWFVSSMLARGVTRLLRAIRFDELMQKSGLADFMAKMGTGTDSAGIVSGLVKWLVRIVVLLVAFDVLGLPAVSDVMRQLLLWLPNLVVAIFVLFIGGIAARTLGNIVRGATAEGGFTNPETLSNVVRTAVWAFAIVVAINQLGIATNLINTLFTGFVGALAIALGLSFGLGGRDLASRTLENWYDQAQEAKPKRKARSDE